MVSWIIEATFLKLSPHVKELQKLAKQEKFSNIERLTWLGTFNGQDVYRIYVNDRALNQKKFKAKKI